MRPFILITSLACVAVVFSCTPTRSTHTGSATAFGVDRQEVIGRSLFDSKDRTISEDDIQRLLKGRIVIPDTVSVAVFKHSGASINRYYTNWWSDEEYLKTQQSFVDTLTSRIGLSKRVKKVIPVPAMMTSGSPTITQLRETAVRLQADVLIVYSVSSDIYYKYKVFQKNEAKAFATCETIVMDTRTGVIPYSSIVTREKLAVKDAQDLTEAETRKKAEREAILLALIETGRGIAVFLDGD